MLVVTRIITNENEDLLDMTFKVTKFLKRVKCHILKFKHLSIEIYDTDSKTKSVVSYKDLRLDFVQSLYGFHYLRPNVFLLFTTTTEAADLIPLVGICCNEVRNTRLYDVDVSLLCSSVSYSGYCVFSCNSYLKSHSVYDFLLTALKYNKNYELSENSINLY